MKSNHFGDVVKVIWESWALGSGSMAPSLFSSEGLCLVGFGIVCVIAIRRYLPTLAASRTLQPAAALEIQQSMRPAAAPRSAPLHRVVATGDTSHAA